MNRTEVRLGAGWLKVVRATAWALMGTLLATGCGVRSGGGGGSGISTTDDHGDIPLDATVMIPDGPSVNGQINFPTDKDWFKFRGIQAITYTLQISGFPTDPKVRADLDLNGNGTFNLTAEIIGTDGATQLQNSAGNEGGTVYDVDPIGTDTEEGVFVTGDSRIIWTCPTTHDYFIRIRHSREQTGIGAYTLHLASSQIATIFQEDTAPQTGGSSVRIVDDEGNLWHDGIITGVVGGTLFEIQEGELVRVRVGFNISECVYDPTQTNVPPVAEPIAIHLHSGHPNNFVPARSSNATPSTSHAGLVSVSLPCPACGCSNPVVSTANVTMEDGRVVNVPVTIEPTDDIGGDHQSQKGYTAALDFTGLSSESRGGLGLLESEVTVTPELIRRIVGFPWYVDLHPVDNMELFSVPVATSLPYGGLYGMFETTLFATPANIVPREDVPPPPSDRGFGFDIFYDSSLKLFQVATQEYFVSPSLVTIFNPDYASFVGDRVKLHEGSAGENGKVLVDLGTLPPILPPPTAFIPSFALKIEEPGFRAPIRQLTDSEVEKLRDAYYDKGVYVEVTDAFTGQQLARAEGLLEISFFPTLEPCDLPPCNSLTREEKPKKGVVTFASALPEGASLDLYANGELLGVLNHNTSTTDLPECGLSGDDRTLATELWPGTYYWHAYGNDGKTYDGHVTVPNGGCQLVVINSDDAD